MWLIYFIYSSEAITLLMNKKSSNGDHDGKN